MDINSPSKRLRRSAAPADASGGRKRRGAGGGVDSETALDQFARDWRDLESGLPFWARVRMEGVDPGALPLRKALWTAVGYLTKWARCSFQCPSSVEAHFQVHRQVLTALAGSTSSSSAHSVCLGLAGDCMWMRDSWTSWQTGDGLQRLLSLVDALVANLETPLHNATPTNMAWVFQSYLPDMVTYSSPVAFLRAFRRPTSGPFASQTPLVGAFSVANNHSADMGPQGACDTLELLDEERIPYSGMSLPEKPHTWCMFRRGVSGSSHSSFRRAVSPGRRKKAQKAADVDGASPTPPKELKVGVYSATWGVNFPDKADACAKEGIHIHMVPGLTSAPPSASGVDLSDALAALEGMANAGCGLRIVSIHWGHEFEGYPTVCQMRVARQLVAAGADIVLGAHSHTQQPAEVLLVNGYTGASPDEASVLEQLPQWCRLEAVDGPPRKALVLYGMGNFCSTMFNEICRVGLLMTLRVSPPTNANSNHPWSWSLPSWHWLYNDAAVIRGATWARGTPRRLIHIASDGAEAWAASTEAKTLASRKRKLVDFVRCHVTGVGPDAQHAAKAAAPERKLPPPMWL